MSEPVRFLNTLAQALATMSLYPGGHPSRARAVDAAYDHLVALQATDPEPQFSFLEHEVIYGRQTLREMRDWSPGMRLAAAGVQRLEFVTAVTHEEFEAFLDDVLERVSGK